MAPEQVRGQAVDARADLFAFGAVLYEMLTGQRAFRRDTAAETMTAILREDPPEFSTVNADLSRRRSIGSSGIASRRIRARAVSDARATSLSRSRRCRIASNDHQRRAVNASPAGVPRDAAPWPGRHRAAGVLRRPDGRVVRDAEIGWSREASSGALSIVIGAATQVTAEDGLEIDPAISPDGKLLAYSAGTATEMRIFIRPVAGGRTMTLSESGNAFEYQPRWSPDGSQILFLTPGRRVRRVGARRDVAACRGGPVTGGVGSRRQAGARRSRERRLPSRPSRAAPSVHSRAVSRPALLRLVAAG